VRRVFDELALRSSPLLFVCHVREQEGGAVASRCGQSVERDDVVTGVDEPAPERRVLAEQAAGMLSQRELWSDLRKGGTAARCLAAQ
jgi:hypothetical protein